MDLKVNSSKKYKNKIFLQEGNLKENESMLKEEAQFHFLSHCLQMPPKIFIIVT